MPGVTLVIDTPHTTCEISPPKTQSEERKVA
jgi:hypothetical protein